MQKKNTSKLSKYLIKVLLGLKLVSLKKNYAKWILFPNDYIVCVNNRERRGNLGQFLVPYLSQNINSFCKNHGDNAIKRNSFHIHDWVFLTTPMGTESLWFPIWSKDGFQNIKLMNMEYNLSHILQVIALPSVDVWLLWHHNLLTFTVPMSQVWKLNMYHNFLCPKFPQLPLCV